jgi:hypothetical protein
MGDLITHKRLMYFYCRSPEFDEYDIFETIDEAPIDTKEEITKMFL